MRWVSLATGCAGLAAAAWWHRRDAAAAPAEKAPALHDTTAAAPPTTVRLLKGDSNGATQLAVCKHVSHHWERAPYCHDVYQNEKKWLLRLRDTGVVTPLLSFDDEKQLLVTAHCGSPVTAETLPEDWMAQRDRILAVLRRHNCRHNDIKPEEIVVHENQLRLVDLGWAHECDAPNPPNWPPGLGSTFRCGQCHDDRCSFDQSIHHVLRLRKSRA